MSLGTNPANAIKPTTLFDYIPMSPVLVAVTHLAARAEEIRQLRIARIQSTSIATFDRRTHHLLLARGELPPESTKTPDQNFANPYLNQPSGAAAHAADEGMLSEDFRSGVGIRVHFQVANTSNKWRISSSISAGLPTMFPISSRSSSR